MYIGKIKHKVCAQVKIGNVKNEIPIDTYDALTKLGETMKLNNVKVNKSKLCKDLNISFNTLDRRLKNIPLKKNRNKTSMIDEYKDEILEILQNKDKSFKSIRILTEYVNKKYSKEFNENTMKYWVNNNSDIKQAFIESKKGTRIGVNTKAVTRFETQPGKQAQFDFKESVKIKLNNGEEIKIHIACLLFSHSRYRLYVLIPDLSVESVIGSLSMMFDKLECVPEEILFDNAKSIMVEARTGKSKGKINPKFKAFADDMGFKVNPCMSRRPQTKGKVESQMRILDDIYSYSGDLDFNGLINLILDIENRENMRFHSEYSKIPELHLKKEKEVLKPLNKELLKSYLPQNFERTINKSGMIKYQNNNYSVDNKYINKKCNVSIFGKYLIIKYSTNKMVSHLISDKKFNYTTKFYAETLSNATNLPLDDEKLKEMVRNNMLIFNNEEIRSNTFNQNWKE